MVDRGGRVSRQPTDLGPVPLRFPIGSYPLQSSRGGFYDSDIYSIASCSREAYLYLLDLNMDLYGDCLDFLGTVWIVFCQIILWAICAQILVLLMVYTWDCIPLIALDVAFFGLHNHDVNIDTKSLKMMIIYFCDVNILPF